MRTMGSLTLCRSLLKAGLVDRFRVVVFPVITGSTGQDRIYDGYPDVALDMISSRTFDGRIQLLEYVPRFWPVRPGRSGRRLMTSLAYVRYVACIDRREARRQCGLVTRQPTNRPSRRRVRPTGRRLHAEPVRPEVVDRCSSIATADRRLRKPA